MGRPRREVGATERHPWLPPIPAEHGARTMLGGALLTPVAVAVIRGIPQPRSAIAYLAFAMLGIVGLAFREAIRRRLMATSGSHHRLDAFVVIEGVAMVLLVATLAALTGAIWGLTIVTIPAILADIYLRQRFFSGRILGTVTGAVALSFAVPLGVLILDIVGLRWAIALYVFFVGFHMTAIVRVLTVRFRDGERYSTARLGNVGFHAGVFAFATGGWAVGIVGPGAPLVFLAAIVRMGYLLRQPEAPAIRELGQGERAFSAVFILGAPWILPL